MKNEPMSFAAELYELEHNRVKLRVFRNSGILKIIVSRKQYKI